jgi:hypothetical protein
MKRARFSRYYLLLCLPVLLALVRLVWGRPVSGGWHAGFQLSDLNGRYNSAEYAYDISSVHNGYDSNVGPPIWVSVTSVMEADGKGDVCGESDGFYGGLPTPGVNTGPAYFYGTYSIDATGRITINTCADTGYCATKGACDTSGATLYRTLVGYLQSNNGIKVTTVDQINNSDASQGGCCASTGYLVHSRVWTKDLLAVGKQ